MAKKSTKTAGKKPKQNGRGSEESRTLKKRKYCDEYAKTGVMLGSCEIVDIHHTTLAKWKEEDPEFREACELAKQVYIERLEKEVDRRAFEGQRRLKFNKNGLVQRDENGDVYEEWNFDSNLADSSTRAGRVSSSAGLETGASVGASRASASWAAKKDRR